MSDTLNGGMPMKLLYIAFTIMPVVFCYSTTYAVNDQYTDRLTTYITILG